MDRWAQLIFHEHGKTFRISLPNLIQAKPFAYNMQQRVIDYFREVAGKREINYILDIGACCGSFAIPYTVMFPNAGVLCLEPSRENFPYLQFNTKDIPQIEIRKLAAHSTTDIVRIAAPTILQRKEPDYDLDTGLISIHGHSQKYAERVNADKLDNIVTRPVDWLKIDVEGHELAVLEGAQRIIKQDRPILQVEVREDNQIMAGQSSAGLTVTMAKMGYAVVGAIEADMLLVSV